MSALAQPKPAEKSHTPRTITAKYGRDPESPSEQLRSQSNYANQTGYAPLFHASLADMFRLCAGSNAALSLLVLVIDLSYGRKRESGERFHEWTEPLTVQLLADITRHDVRDIQRQLVELPKRGIIAVKTRARGRYSISLLYKDWEACEDYAVWKRKQKVVTPIDDGEGFEAADEDVEPVSKEAVLLTKKPQELAPGRACRAIPVKCGVSAFKLQNESPLAGIKFSAVIQSGVILVSASSSETVEQKANKGEEKAKFQRHPCREAPKIPPFGGSRNPSKKLWAEHDPRAPGIAALFDPVLLRHSAVPISRDLATLKDACLALGDMPLTCVESYLESSKRGKRKITGPRAVVGIIGDAYLIWQEQHKAEVFEAERDKLLAQMHLSYRKGGEAELRATLKRALADPECESEHAKARRVLELLA